MVLKREVVQARLEDLDHTLERLARHRDVELSEYEADLDLQWGLGGFRNLLVHEYLELDDARVHRYLQEAFSLFPRFGREVLAWKDETAAG